VTTCGVHYYPSWSSRGVRSVQCEHPAKFTIIDPPQWSAEVVCGTHAKVVERYYGSRDRILDGIWTKT